MNNTILVLIVLIAIYGLSLYKHETEGFSNSGLNMWENLLGWL